MKLPILFLILLALTPVTGWAAPPGHSGESDLPKEMEVQEHLVLLSAKVNNLAEVQDLVLKQQQLILEHLEAIRREVDQLKQERANSILRTEFDARLDRLQQQFQSTQETNLNYLTQLVQDLVARSNEARMGESTNGNRALRFEIYRVQNGDTLLKIVARVNEAQARNNLPRITQDQIEKFNPGLSPDKIRVGQLILIPVPEKP